MPHPEKMLRRVAWAGIIVSLMLSAFLALIVGSWFEFVPREDSARRSTRQTVSFVVALVRHVERDGAAIAPDGEMRFSSDLLSDPAVQRAWQLLSEQGEDAIRDAWGQEVRIRVTQSMGTRRKLVEVWSVGPNGIDEYGANDDIFLRAPL